MEDELNKARAELARWQSPAEFIALVNKWEAQTPKEVFLVGAPGGFLREAWVLAKYVKQVTVERVRLAPEENWPDGYIEIGGEPKSVEITEVMEPWRKRDEEVKNPGPAIQMDPVENWVKRAEAIPGALRARIENKANKQYGSPARLLVYLNISEFDIRQKETEKAIADAKAQCASSFADIVVLWKDRLY